MEDTRGNVWRSFLIFCFFFFQENYEFDFGEWFLGGRIVSTILFEAIDKKNNLFGAKIQ